jgi:hypothetical protein
MATFPALNPTSRTYIPGQPPATALTTLNGDELSVRHNNASTKYILRLGFNGITPDEHFAINSHYSIHGRFQPFDLPTSILLGGNFSFPANYLWIYGASPDTQYDPGVIAVTVELELVPPYLV